MKTEWHKIKANWNNRYSWKPYTPAPIQQDLSNFPSLIGPIPWYWYLFTLCIAIRKGNCELAAYGLIGSPSDHKHSYRLPYTFWTEKLLWRRKTYHPWFNQQELALVNIQRHMRKCCRISSRKIKKQSKESVWCMYREKRSIGCI